MPFPKTVQAFGHGQDKHAQASPAGSHPHWHMLVGHAGPAAPIGPAAKEWFSPSARSRLSPAPQTRVTYARGSSDIPKSLSSLNSPKHGTYVRIYCWVFIFCRCFKGCVWIWCLLTHTVLCIWWTRVRFHKWASLTTKKPCMQQKYQIQHTCNKKWASLPSSACFQLLLADILLFFPFGGCRGSRTSCCDGEPGMLLRVCLYGSWSCMTKPKQQRQNWISKLVGLLLRNSMLCAVFSAVIFSWPLR